MKTPFRVLTAVFAAGMVILATPVMATGRTAPHVVQNMSPMHTMSDDKCEAKCDEESDKCMSQAGKDAAKQRQCDAGYDDCLRKCQGN